MTLSKKKSGKIKKSPSSFKPAKEKESSAFPAIPGVLEIMIYFLRNFSTADSGASAAVNISNLSSASEVAGLRAISV